MPIPGCVLPVLDLMDGKVVHAVAGQRSSYQPLVSRWTSCADDPIQLTTALKEQLRLTEFYVADLDALQGQGSQTELIEKLIAQGYRIWLDAGIQSIDEANAWLDRGVHRVIVAGESLPSVSLLEQLADAVDVTRLVYSLDLVAGQVRCRPGVFDSMTPLEIVTVAFGLGIRKFIILDTASVGISKGPATITLCQDIRDRYPDCELISGGGVRGIQDIELLQAAGVNRVLVSTWLHANPTTNALESNAAPAR